MKDPLRISTAQFENASGDKSANLAIIRKLATQAASTTDNLAFHECSITGYTFAQCLSRSALLSLAEHVPNGPSTQELISIARSTSLTVLAGLFEKETDPHDDVEKIYNTYICVSGAGVLAKHRKPHPFISRHLSSGTAYTVFETHGWRAGILICYDNHVVENVRATALLGAEILFAPHVTMCTPSPRPRAGFVDPKLWENRDRDPTALRAEFEGLKGRRWLMKWLPARAYDNGVYVVFSNPIRMDDDQLKNGWAMVLDPFGDVVAEGAELGRVW